MEHAFNSTLPLQFRVGLKWTTPDFALIKLQYTEWAKNSNPNILHQIQGIRPSACRLVPSLLYQKLQQKFFVYFAYCERFWLPQR